MLSLKPQADEAKELVQKEALAAWIAAGKKGTGIIITGLGKTFISLNALYTFPKGSKVVFLAETTQRELDLNMDIIKYNKIYDRNVKEDYQFEFMCYQTAYKLENNHYNLIIADRVLSA
jgi:superfamily II DNA or RNA helicase